ncbi:MAG: hypothetical protein LUF85_12825 [Bacteroides sp.]|nr:hypothetical protein [Bacteroides sp.]
MDARNPETWPGISWQDGIGSEITEIIWDRYSSPLTGCLDLSGSSKLRKLIINKGIDSIILPKNLEILELSSNTITYLDLSEFDLLRELTLNITSLGSLILPNESAIEKLDISSECLSHLNSGALGNLRELSIDLDALESIDLSPMVYLKTLSVSGEPNCRIDLSDNKTLEELRVGNQCNILPGAQPLKRYRGAYREDFIPDTVEELYIFSSEKVIDLKRFSRLRKLTLSGVDFKGNTLPASLESIDITVHREVGEIDPDKMASIDLELIYMEPSKLSDLVLSHCVRLKDLTINSGLTEKIFDQIEKLSELRHLSIYGDCSNNAAYNTKPNSARAHLDFRRLRKLTTLEVVKCGLQEIDLSLCDSLEILNLTDNYLERLNLSGNPRLVELDTSLNILDTLSLVHNTELVSFTHTGNGLSCVIFPSGNKIRSVRYWGNNLDLKKLPFLEELDYMGSPNENLDFSHNKHLKALGLSDVHRDIDIVHNTELEYLSVSGSGVMTRIDLSRHTKLGYFTAEFLTVGDIIFPPESSNLVYINIQDVKMGQLDVSAQHKLISLRCSSCGLRSLKLPQSNNVLRYLDCSHNDLTELDISRLKQLKTLDYSYNNHLPEVDVSAIPLLRQVRNESNRK